MKKNPVILSFAIVFSLMTIFTFAAEDMSIDVPFVFYVEDQLFPAGQYHFDMNHGNYATASFVNIWAPEGVGNKVLMTTAGTDKNATANQLVFNKYGKKLFLSAISINGYKATLKVLNFEREMRSQARQDLDVITVAQK